MYLRICITFTNVQTMVDFAKIHDYISSRYRRLLNQTFHKLFKKAKTPKKEDGPKDSLDYSSTLRVASIRRLLKQFIIAFLCDIHSEMQYKQDPPHLNGVANQMDMPDDFTGRFREMLPSETQDRIAMFILFVVLPFGFLFEIFAILPTEHEVMSKGWNLRVGILMLFGLNAFANVYKIISVGPNGKHSDLPAVQKHGYRYCYNCQLNEPPRSRHCPVCDKCAFRRDHHCSFVAVCIGHFNQRYYISAICSLWIISSVMLTWNWSFMWTSLGGFSPLQLWELIFFRISLRDDLRLFIYRIRLSVLSDYSSAFCLYRGQTRVEYLLDVHAYNLGFMENFRQVMGRRWLIALLVPFISSPLDSDGLSYPTRESKPLNDMKTM
ncbi:Palmitoyltransferase [Dirofilaria immitis]|nr:Palmitoyltransferase [Dirofilaria immitis]